MAKNKKRIHTPGILAAIMIAAGWVNLCMGADPQTPDVAAAALLDTANRTFNQQKYDEAADRFREFLKLYPSNLNVSCANYGLSLAMVESPRRDYSNAIPPLLAVTQTNFTDRATALYYLGLARRGLGEAILAQAATRPPAEADPLRAAANQRFAEAAGSFADAAAAFGVQTTTNQNWAARARGDATDILLRLARWKEAAEAAETFLNDPAFRTDPYRERAVYHLGYARFGQKQYIAAGRVLSQLAPFQQEFGVHARYLLGRVHYLANERAEAAIQYRAALADYEQRKRLAQNPNALPLDKREAYAALLRDPAPDYLSRAVFYLAMTACESDRFGEALDGFTTFIQQNPKAPYVPEAQLRLGFCRLQAGNYAEAAAVLQTLTNQPPRADRALWWLARCQTKLADPKNPPAYDAAMNAATENLRRAADLAAKLAPADPEANIRRGEILMDLADTLVVMKRYQEAADTYQQAAQENPSANRVEEAAQRRITALHLGGFYRESDEMGARFEQAYPRSILLPEVLFRRAENAYLIATVLATNTAALSSRSQELPPLLGEAIARYQRLIIRFPDFAGINQVREGLGSCYYRQEKYEDAAAVLGAIPADSCNGELAQVPYLLADCLIRCTPQDSSDALTAAALLSKAEQASKLLDAFIASNDKSPILPDALLKLGWCHSRMAEMMAKPEERKQALASGRSAYDRLIQRFPQEASLPVAFFERAGCLAGLADTGGAINELNRFLQDPLRGSAVAPLALARLADLMRLQNRGAEAANVLQQYRTQFEAGLLKDPAQAIQVPNLQYEQALSLRQAGKATEARALFESLVKDFPTHPAAGDAAWRAAEYRRAELTNRLDIARLALARPGLKPEERTAAQRGLSDTTNAMAAALSALLAGAEALDKTGSGTPPHQGALYDAAWHGRLLAGLETEATLRGLRQAAVSRLRARLAYQIPTNQIPAVIREPDISLAEVALPPAERTAMDCYERLIAAAPDAPLAAQARLELAELLMGRSRADAALPLLGQALAHRPPLERVPMIRVQLAAACLGVKNPKAALAQAEIVASDATSPLAPAARCLAGEALARLQDWNRTLERLVPFRDQGPLQNLPDVSDRALLRLGQVYLETAQWDPCRSTLAALMQRFPLGVRLDEALYITGRSWEKQEQYDRAVEAYQQLAGRTASEWGAQAQIRIGLCRFAQKRNLDGVQTLLAVPLTYEYPEWQAAAYGEAARIYVEMKQPDEAVRLLQRIVRDYAKTPWAQTARERLPEFGGDR